MLTEREWGGVVKECSSLCLVQQVSHKYWNCNVGIDTTYSTQVIQSSTCQSGVIVVTAWSSYSTRVVN